MTQTRFGMGTTVNLAHKGGFITEMIGIVSLLSIPIICVWLIMLEFTPLEIKVENDIIICEQLRVNYEIPLTEILEYEVVTELPSFVKVSGNGMDNQLSGTFEVYREGMFELFLNPQNTLFIRIVTKEQTYYISGMNDEMTRDVIKALNGEKITR